MQKLMSPVIMTRRCSYVRVGLRLTPEGNLVVEVDILTLPVILCHPDNHVCGCVNHLVIYQYRKLDSG